MEELTNKQKCLKMWEWLAENPSQEKQDYLAFGCDITGAPLHECYACEDAGMTIGYEDEEGEELVKCSNCPLIWTNTDEYMPCVEEGPYYSWDHSFDAEDRTKYALQMVQLIKTTWKE